MYHILRLSTSKNELLFFRAKTKKCQFFSQRAKPSAFSKLSTLLSTFDNFKYANCF